MHIPGTWQQKLNIAPAARLHSGIMLPLANVGSFPRRCPCFSASYKHAYLSCNSLSLSLSLFLPSFSLSSHPSINPPLSSYPPSVSRHLLPPLLSGFQLFSYTGLLPPDEKNSHIFVSVQIDHFNPPFACEGM